MQKSQNNIIEDDANVEFLIHIARQYFFANMTQAEIAQKNNISRPQVSKLLARSKEMGIVTITVQSPANNLIRLQKCAIDTFSLTDCLVLPTFADDRNAELQFMQSTVEYIDRLISNVTVIGLGWGSLLKDLTVCDARVQNIHKKNRIVLPLTGSIMTSNDGYNTNELVRAFSLKFDLAPEYLYSPAFPSSLAEQNQFLTTANYQTINAHWNNMDVAIMRICNYPCVPDLATKSRFGDELMIKHAVGALLAYFYDINGNFIEGLDDYHVCALVEQMRNTSIRLGICSNRTIPSSLLGALRTGLVTHLIITENILKQTLLIMGT